MSLKLPLTLVGFVHLLNERTFDLGSLMSGAPFSRLVVPAGKGFESLGEGDLPSEHFPMEILFLVLASPLLFLLLLVCATLGCPWS